MPPVSADGYHSPELFTPSALLRRVGLDEALPLLQLHAQALAHFQKEPGEATALVEAARVGELESATPETAAWIVVCSAILNLDEFLTRN